GPAGGGGLMSADIADLAMLLFLPWFLILAADYWWLPRDLPVTPALRGFDLLALLLAFGLACLAGRWGYAMAAANIEAGPIWRQVLACLLAYKAFLLVVIAAWLWRRARFRPAVAGCAGAGVRSGVLADAGTAERRPRPHHAKALP